MAVPFKKQVSMYVSIDDYMLLRAEAARRKLPMTDLIRSWAMPHVKKLRRRKSRQGD